MAKEKIEDVLYVRVHSDTKKRLESLAESKRTTVARVCRVLLEASLDELGVSLDPKGAKDVGI